MPVAIDPTQPWSDWKSPNVFNANLAELNVIVENDRLQLRRGDENLGRPTERFLTELGWTAGFPANFLPKVSASIAAQVINHRMMESRDREVSIIGEDEDVENFAAGWRGVVPYAETAQSTYNSLRSVYDNVAVDYASKDDGRMQTTFTLPDVVRPITPRKGDMLAAGIMVEQCYGTSINVSLYTKRLICLNGMTANRSEFSWTQRTAGTVEHQLQWLHGGIMQALGEFEPLVERAAQMATVNFTGDPRRVLMEHARAMKMPARYESDLWAAFSEEPGESLWHILNAFTRFATYGAMDDRTRRRLMASSGQWACEFDMVDCRLPRAIAISLGAEIMEAHQGVTT